MPVGSRVAFLVSLALTLASAGCMTKRQAVSMRTGGEAMPIVEVKPGYVERIALMDQYRLHDEMRQHMMHRPHVTVEELTPEEVEALPAEEEEAAEAQPQAAAPIR
jgi:hypothetical protein